MATKHDPARDEPVQLDVGAFHALMKVERAALPIEDASDKQDGETHTPRRASGGEGARLPPSVATIEGDEPNRWLISVTTNMQLDAPYLAAMDVGDSRTEYLIDLNRTGGETPDG
jgi:hypothetical protein